ncbi:hypothetical protein BN3087_220038 [Sulfurovum sp. enrichment culture clone C5]|uniref:Peptidase C51 domain-containing protein n=1 Tax=Sulfurovum sp. enrichment culture clone C5 TaxID=497650 RepID=A0A0S4XMQ0_9BACT|nr:hypothetical protein BN3087_220038 [Sulfurovum sp. enrichment culture clone C5]
MNKAVKELQQFLNKNGSKLVVDGDLGSETKKAITSLCIPVWLKNAMKYIGVHEIHGTQNDVTVMKWHKLSGGFSNDEIAWCGSYVNGIMIESGFKKTVSSPARALSWLEFGVSSKPVIGAIAVKSRIGGGHVGFLVATEGKYVYILGGNQSDEVNIRRYLVSDFKDYRVPQGYQNCKYTTLMTINAETGGKEV